MGRLHRLVESSRHEEVKALIESGVDVNEVANNLTPLEEAIHNEDVVMVDILIRAGADVNHGHPRTGRRPLASAVTKSDLRIVELLLKAGADVEGCRETSTPLCIAATFGKRDAYDRLIAAGANPQAIMHGKTASELLESSGDKFDMVRQHFETEAQNKKPDQYEHHIRKMMAEYSTVEEYAAHKGRLIYVYRFDRGIFTDPEVGKWAQDLGEIIHSSEQLQKCEEQFLSGDKSAAANQERKRLERWQARELRRKERIATATEGYSQA